MSIGSDTPLKKEEPSNDEIPVTPNNVELLEDDSEDA